MTVKFQGAGIGGGLLEIEDEQMLLNEQKKVKLLKSFVNLFEILFLFNYSVNFFVYLMHGPLFRKIHSKKMSNFFKILRNIFKS